MNINTYKQTNSSPSFKKIQLAKVEQESVTKLLNNLLEEQKESNIEAIKYRLFTIFDKHLKNEVARHSDSYISKEDFLQTLYLKFFSFLDSIKNNKLNPVNFIDALNNVTPQKEDKNNIIISLDNTKYINSKITLKELLTEEDLPTYSKKKSDDEILLVKKDFENITKNVQLSDRKKEIIELLQQGYNFTKILQLLNLSDHTVRYLYHSSIANIQKHNNVLPQNLINLAQKYQNYFEAEDKNLLEDLLIKSPFLWTIDINKTLKNTDKICEYLKFSKQEYFDMILKCPQLLTREEKTIITNIEEGAKLLKIKRDEYKKIFKQRPVLLLQKPSTLYSNIQKSAELLGIRFEDLIKCVKKQPQLLYHSPETLENNVKISSQLLGIKPSDFLKCALKQPSLFYHSPESLHAKAQKSAKLLKTDTFVFVKIAMKYPSLLYAAPETIIANLQNSSKILKIEQNDFIAMSMKAPALLYLKPETLHSNVQKATELLKIDFSKFIEAAKKRPQILYLSPDTLFSNLQKSADLFNIEFSKFLDLALRYQPLIYQRPETLYSNIKGSAELTKQPIEYLIERALKSPMIFVLSPNSFYKTVAINNFYKKIKGEEEKFTIDIQTTEKKFERILAYLLKNIFRGFVNVSQTNLWNILEKNPDKNLIFEIPQDELAEEFKQYIQNSFEKHSVKNKYEVIIK